MVVEACDNCKALNTETLLFELSEERVDPRTMEKTGLQVFSVARRYPFTNNSKRFCEKCLRTELSNLIEELKKQK